MQIRIVTEITDEITQAFQRLLPQLSKSVVLPDKNYLEKIVLSGSTILFVAEDEGRIVGTLSLVAYNIPTGHKVWIEDVVTDDSVRGKGIGRSLIKNALEYAKKKGISKVDLTSANDRIAAHQLYKNTGFQERETTVFRKVLK